MEQVHHGKVGLIRNGLLHWGLCVVAVWVFMSYLSMWNLLAGEVDFSNPVGMLRLFSNPVNILGVRCIDFFAGAGDDLL